MKKISFYFILTTLLVTSSLKADIPNNHSPLIMHPSVQTISIYGNNMQIPFMTNGIFNGYLNQTNLIWPASANTTRMAIDFSSGLWLGAKVILPGGQKELRTAAALYNSLFTAGNIPVIGQVPPQSVCDDPTLKPYVVNLIDRSLINGGVRSRVVGGQLFTVTYDSWASWPVSKGAPYVEVNGVDGYQPGWFADRPGVGFGTVRPSEICFMTYMDYTHCTDSIHLQEMSLPGGTKPMGVEVQQIAYIFNCPGYEKSYFISWKIINKSATVWDSTIIGVSNDADIGDASDDATGCDSARDMAFIYNQDNNDLIYGVAPPAIGSRLIQGPIVYTGNNSDTVKLPYRTYIGYRMEKLYAENVFQNVSDPCFGDPDNAIAGYNYLLGLDGCGHNRINPITGHVTKFEFSGDACNKIGWYDSLPNDRRTIQSAGPLTMNPGDTQTIVMAFVIGRSTTNNQSVCQLLTESDAIKNAYYNGLCSSIIGIKPISDLVPEKYELFQNYPNPFNPNTKIKFDLAGSTEQNVKLIIYDAIGRVVTTLIDYEMKPGSYETDWNGSDFSSGIYFFRLEAGSFISTKKMVMIK